MENLTCNRNECHDCEDSHCVDHNRKWSIKCHFKSEKAQEISIPGNRCHLTRGPHVQVVFLLRMEWNLILQSVLGMFENEGFNTNVVLIKTIQLSLKSEQIFIWQDCLAFCEQITSWEKQLDVAPESFLSDLNTTPWDPVCSQPALQSHISLCKCIQVESWIGIIKRIQPILLVWVVPDILILRWTY